MHGSRNQKNGPARTAFLAVGTIILLTVLAALLASCAKVEPVRETEDTDFSDSDLPVKSQPSGSSDRNAAVQNSTPDPSVEQSTTTDNQAENISVFQ